MKNITPLKVRSLDDLKSLRSLYQTHLTSEYKIKLNQRVLDESLADFLGYKDFNTLIAATKAEHGLSPDFKPTVLLLRMILDENVGMSVQGRLGAFKHSYAEHFKLQHGTPLKETKLNKRFSLLFGCDSISELLHFATGLEINVGLYLAALSANVNTLRESYNEIGFSMVESVLARMEHQVPANLVLPKSFLESFAHLISASDLPNPILSQLLITSPNTKEFLGTVRDWVSNVGIGLKLSDEFRVFVTHDCIYEHSQARGNTWMARIKPKGRVVNEGDFKRVFEQVNVTWEDVDYRGKYDSNRLNEEIMRFDELGSDLTEVCLEYSAAYRGKMRLVAG